ncbi:ABC transporter permease [Streptomyces subrutilus]|uniref:ABC transporter permease n=1 Tax=Streptomyces subrutilus TaxID=36818 RepID=A0A5P2UED2_9ACTN|nr:ABC transporter permease [Streptomyces subrutilus]QEU77290.1 ABC transporter permease [Streptomyces subrutilus]WSJ33635.1 ABC transporter permease [Streptomyces subrutilus]GGZ46240.1 ABC transporter permease [Streptomyces subrutilus]
MANTRPLVGRVLRSPVFFSVAAAVAVGALFLVGTGADPVTAYGAVFTGSLGSDGIGSTLTTGTSVLGMALALAIPLRAGLVNLGGDGQLVVGGISAAAVGLYAPLPPALTTLLALLAAMAAGALYAALAAVCDIRFGVPLLVSSLLLSYPASSLASYLVRYPLKEPGSSLPQTRRLPEGVELPAFGASTVTAGLVLVALAAVAYHVVDTRTAVGYEMRMTGLNPRFSAAAGVARGPQTLRLMAVSGAMAGLVGAVGVLSFPFRFLDGALTAPGYTWTGLTAALLAGAAPLGTVLASFFFAALQVGGLAMERTTEVPRELAQVLQAVVIVFLAARLRITWRPGRRRDASAPSGADRGATGRITTEKAEAL